jgi:hypothetical protein
MGGIRSSSRHTPRFRFRLRSPKTYTNVHKHWLVIYLIIHTEWLYETQTHQFVDLQITSIEKHAVTGEDWNWAHRRSVVQCLKADVSANRGNRWKPLGRPRVFPWIPEFVGVRR